MFRRLKLSRFYYSLLQRHNFLKSMHVPPNQLGFNFNCYCQQDAVDIMRYILTYLNSVSSMRILLIGTLQMSISSERTRIFGKSVAVNKGNKDYSYPWKFQWNSLLFKCNDFSHKPIRDLSVVNIFPDSFITKAVWDGIIIAHKYNLRATMKNRGTLMAGQYRGVKKRDLVKMWWQTCHWNK